MNERQIFKYIEKYIETRHFDFIPFILKSKFLDKKKKKTRGKIEAFRFL